MGMKAVDIDRIEEHLRSRYAFGYTPGSKDLRQLNNIVIKIKGLSMIALQKSYGKECLRSTLTLVTTFKTFNKTCSL